MYFSIAFVIFAFLLVFVLATGRRRWAIKKIYSMCCEEKCALLNDLIAPFGYCYIECQDIISSRNDAWQRDMGYTYLFDRMAAYFNMVLDSLPVYFNYEGRTWLIEFWKGQYGINTGAEIGVYYADRVLPGEELKSFLFQAVEDNDMLPLSFELSRTGSDGCPCSGGQTSCPSHFPHCRENAPLASVSKKTWWLTAFCMGRFSQPWELSMNSSLHFPNCEMRCQFVQGLQQAGLSKEHFRICGNTVHVRYDGEMKKYYGCFTRLSRGLAQLSNRIFSWLYLLITRPFTLTLDRLLYLYFLLPFAFRRMVTLRRYRRCAKCCQRKRF